MQQAIVRRVDHVTVRVKTPRPLFSALHQQLLLPQAWAVTTNPFYSSGGLHLGNMNLEVMQFGEQSRPARLFGIAFELEPFETSLPQLEERGIPHTPPMPFYLVDDQGWQVTGWTSVFLGGLLPSSPTARLFFTLSRRAPKETWESGSLPKPFNRQFGLPFIYNTVYRHGITVAMQYNPAWRAQHISQEPTRTGLDVQKVFEITIGTRSYDQTYPCWKALLKPHKEVAPGVWALPDGAHIRLIKHSSDGLRRMIWQVASLNRAAQFLHKRGMLGKEKNGMPTIDSTKIQGLDIRLVQ